MDKNKTLKIGKKRLIQYKMEKCLYLCERYIDLTKERNKCKKEILKLLNEIGEQESTSRKSQQNHPHLQENLQKSFDLLDRKIERSVAPKDKKNFLDAILSDLMRYVRTIF
ncbi:hypothetical protein MHBO_000622 [Bonamia ostreae]|uniref:Uncharacterized protein n=1 Tax=Bonamia ostreae TaxID=126728 RepID=A0ABV2AHG3_9EUKA